MSSQRVLVLLRVDGAEPAVLGRALGVVAAEAAQRLRRGGWQLLRIAEPSAAEALVQPLREAGLCVVLLAEAEVRAASQPVMALGGEHAPGRLSVRTTEGPLSVTTADLGLVIQGPITREYQTSQVVKRSRTATLEAGYRYHLHRRGDPRPVELDPDAFDFGAAAAAARSSRLQLSAWVQDLAAGVSVDDGFRRLPPELGVAEAAAGGLLSAANALGVRGGRGESTLVLDSLRQFRFYSAWRALVERSGGSLPRGRGGLGGPESPPS